MTPKQIAEKYVREKIPELMQLSFGCEVKVMWGGIGAGFPEKVYATYLHGIRSRHKLMNSLGETKTFGISSLETIGHPMQLHHWLSVLEKVTYVLENGGGLHVFAFEGDDMPERINFDLTTGQPATEADYQAFNEIVGAKEI